MHNQLWRRVRTRRAGVVILLALLFVGIPTASWAVIVGAPRTSSSTSVNLQSGLVGWWKLDGNFKDSSPNGYNGVPTGSLTSSTDRKGNANGAMAGTGSQYLTFGDHPAYDAKSLTLAAWIKPNGLTGYQEILSKELNYKVRLNGTSIEVLVGGAGTAWTSDSVFANAVTTTNWTHVAVAVNSTAGTVSLYINGSLFSSTGGISPITANNTRPLMAYSYTGLSEIFSGSLDDLRMYNRPLSAAEVATLANSYDAGVKVDSGENGLVGWWKLDGNGNDASPYADNGTLFSTAATTDRKGSANGALNFNGTSSCVRLPATSSTPYYNPTALTVSAWVKPTAVASYQTVVRLGLGADVRYQLYVGTGGSLNYSWWNGSIFANIGSPANAVPQNSWSLVSVTRDSAYNVTLYVNGSAVKAGVASAATTAPSGMSIGATNCAANQWFTGSIDDVRIYNRALSQSEITAQAAEYNSVVAQSTLQKGLVGYWPLNGNAKDATPRADNGTVTNDTLTTDRKGRANSAYYSDGSVSSRIQLPVGTYESLGTNSFTVSAWVQTTESINQRCVFSTASAGQGFRFGYSAGLPYYLVGDGSSFHEGTIGTTKVNDGAWHNLVITYIYSAGWTVNSYVDGNYSGSTVQYTGIGSVNGVQADIGSMNGSGNGILTGSFDDVRVYNRALSTTEISALAHDYS